MILLIALRNLLTNFRHTIIIMFLIMLIVMLFFIGNTAIDASDEGLKNTYILNYTGDVIIQEKTDVPMSVFGANAPAIGEFFSIPILKDHDDIISLVESMPDAGVITSQISGPVVMDIGDGRYKTFAFGIEAQTYFNVFSGITLVEGELLKPGQRGAMISKERASMTEEEFGKPVAPGDMIMFTTVGATGFKIREVPLAGIYEYKNQGQIPDEIVLVDAQTLRALNSILLAPETDVPPPPQSTDILTDDIDSLFGAESFPTPVDVSGPVSITEIQAQLSNREEQPFLSTDKGGWNFIIIRLKDGVSNSDFIQRLNGQLESYSAIAVDWRTAAGAPALLVLLLYFLFNGGLLLLVIAGIIAIVNVLLISIFQRVKEIGTLRAIGASNNYIRVLILSENLIVAIVSGLLGVIAGAVLIQIINGANIQAANSLIITLLGGKVVKLGFSESIAIVSILVSAALGFLASLYPVQFALHIQPVEAVAKG
ncbi:MAG: FtsX-like permease family protein [Spirochaetaceae bacterium]|nr:MAG: FtsX-like permease family protein [Spirochaetaceae bacterium]